MVAMLGLPPGAGKLNAVCLEVLRSYRSGSNRVRVIGSSRLQTVELERRMTELGIPTSFVDFYPVHEALIFLEGARSADQVIARSSKSALPERIAGLTCGQAIMIVILGLAVLMYMDLPPESRARTEGLLTVLGAAIWLAARITKDR